MRCTTWQGHVWWLCTKGSHDVAMCGGKGRQSRRVNGSKDEGCVTAGSAHAAKTRFAWQEGWWQQWLPCRCVARKRVCDGTWGCSKKNKHECGKGCQTCKEKKCWSEWKKKKKGDKTYLHMEMGQRGSGSGDEERRCCAAESTQLWEKWLGEAMAWWPWHWGQRMPHGGEGNEMRPKEMSKNERQQRRWVTQAGTRGLGLALAQQPVLKFEVGT